MDLPKDKSERNGDTTRPTQPPWASMSPDGLIAALRVLDQAAADIDELARQVGRPLATVREVASWPDLVSLLIDVGEARGLARSTPTDEELRAGRDEAEPEPSPPDGAPSAPEAPFTGLDTASQSGSRSAAQAAPVTSRSNALGFVTPEWFDSQDQALATVAAADVLCFVLGDRSLPDRSGRWPALIERPLRYGRHYLLCETARTAVEGTAGPHPESLERYLARFTRRIIRLEQEATWAVMQAIWEDRWRNAEAPVAYVRTVADRIYALELRSGLDPRSADVFVRSDDAGPLSLDLPRSQVELTGDPLAALIPEPDSTGSYQEVVTPSIATPHSSEQGSARTLSHSLKRGSTRLLYGRCPSISDGHRRR